MRCPHCGETCSAREAHDGGENVVRWYCVRGCGVGGTIPRGPTDEDTQVDIYQEAKHGPGPDPLDEPPF